MSLKAKLEAVIYAAEEPVTLAQLAALFATDALEWKAAQEAASAETAAAQASPESMPLQNAAFNYLESEQETSEAAPDEASEARRESSGEAAQEADAAEVDAEPVTEAN